MAVIPPPVKGRLKQGISIEDFGSIDDLKKIILMFPEALRGAAMEDALVAAGKPARKRAIVLFFSRVKTRKGPASPIPLSIRVVRGIPQRSPSALLTAGRGGKARNRYAAHANLVELGHKLVLFGRTTKRRIPGKFYLRDAVRQSKAKMARAFANKLERDFQRLTAELANNNVVRRNRRLIRRYEIARVSRVV